MRGLIVCWFSLLLSLGAQAQWSLETDPSAPKFCLQNFNAYGPIYAQRVAERTSRMISELGASPSCEVVHLQEVWNSGQTAQIENGLKHRYHMSSPNKTAKIGLMTMVSGKLRDQQTFEFKVNHEGGVLDGIRKIFRVRKAFHIAKAQVGDLQESIYFLNTHLHPSSPSVRIAQLLDILNWRLKNHDLKWILSGDFNADVATFERRFVLAVLGVHDSMEQYLGHYPQEFCTYCRTNPLSWLRTNRVFDYIFYSNIGSSQTQLRAVDGRVNLRGTPQRPLSDHYGVQMHFALEPAVSIFSEQVYESRKMKTLQVIEVAQSILESQTDAEFQPYKDQLVDMARQLKTRRGPYFDYYARFY